ncbi:MULTISPECIES: glyoxalase superfamily protein [Bacillaceae]|uniref:Bleomycin resistance protein n=1 Tax=Gottfriedia luciferensis TaxID=178774 RepID=A0ABX2ZU54_9BACI|nr:MULTISPECIES: glyoxalase superfamily protein [Bacillaceae]ODG93255.1 bleomycin resistance protein [Gottfriedia luciferensis]PGZ95093.1 glyoxalase/bleomycin resistance/extradiol dioxygenase family protein [Bacillus sp. AFS029533]
MSTTKITMKSPTPILRMFDEDKAKEFYITFLEFEIDWEHRFEEDFPLYMQISYNNCIIHLSEHHGDCSPGAAIRIEVENLDLLHSKLLSKKYKYARPGIEETPWKTREVRVGDPFGNRIVFYENMKD